MKNQSKLSLIDGSFTPQEALDILMNLYSSKINFHELKCFSSIERFGHEDEHSAKRIPELKASRNKISIMLKELENSDEEINIQSEVIISFNTAKNRKTLQAKG
jgi:hypothetical protein